MAAHQAPPSLGFSRQEHWSGLPFPSPMHESEKWKWSCSVVSDSQRPHGLQPTRLLHPWDFPDKSTGVGCHCLLRLQILGWLKSSFRFFPVTSYWIIKKKNQQKKTLFKSHGIRSPRSSLVVQWLRIHLPIQGTQVQCQVAELKSHIPWGKPVYHN